MIENILSKNLDGLRLELSIKNNQQLLNNFMNDFLLIGDYKPNNDNDKWQIMDYCRIYIEEIEIRMNDAQNIISLLNIIKKKMKEDSKNDKETFYTRNLLRVYSLGIERLKDFNVDNKFIKWNFL